MIRKLEVKGLNNRVDAAMEFNEDLNIITGRNGSGKTTLLKLIWYVISGNIGHVISDIPFQSVSIETNSFFLSIQAESDNGELQYQFVNGRKRNKNFEIPLQDTDDKWINPINVGITRAMNSSLFFPSFRRIEGGYARNTKYIPSDNVVKTRLWPGYENIEGQFQEAVSEISTEMSANDNHKFIASISTHDIGELLEEKHADITKKTDELHANLSKDITQKISERKPSDDAISLLDGIQKRVEGINKERDSLFRPFSVLAEQIRDIFHYEGISVTKGITFGEAKEAIESDKLSAGEKQMLSFLCYNTFSENTAIFIDEPELSLHVDWQRLLLPTLLEQETGNQFFIATHSPFIYAKYPDKEILLGEDRGGD